MEITLINWLGIILAYMSLWFGVSLVTRRNDVADIAWGLGFTLIGWISWIAEGMKSGRSLVVPILVTFWGFRLAFHIYGRNRGKKEDHRYREWREKWGKWFLVRSFFQVYVLQGLFMFLITWPVRVATSFGGNMGLLEWLGLVVWGVGFYWESVGDWQLKKFISQPENKGKLMQSGLWRYSRHPNYFGEVTQWWGIWLMVLNTPNGWQAIIGPITITWLILKVSGVPLLEKKYEGRSDWEEYKRKTSVFIPWVNKK